MELRPYLGATPQVPYTDSSHAKLYGSLVALCDDGIKKHNISQLPSGKKH